MRKRVQEIEGPALPYERLFGKLRSGVEPSRPAAVAPGKASRSPGALAQRCAIERGLQRKDPIPLNLAVAHSRIMRSGKGDWRILSVRVGLALGML